MTDHMPPDGLPLALLVEDREERMHWLAHLFETSGYAVLRERTARHARERARAAQPDLILTAADLPDMSGIELCRALCTDAQIPSSTPVFIALPESESREQRLAALRAGAWECITPPHDPDEILLKANAYVRAKRAADRMRIEGLIDAQTGLYNRQGLARRARELASQAVRDHGALTCLVLALDLEIGGPAALDDSATGALTRGVHLLQAAARRSDVIGRLGTAEFAVLAPGTDAIGARRLAERLAGSLEIGTTDARALGLPGVRVRCGYEAVANMAYAPIEPSELLMRAAAALRTGQAEGGGWLRRFEAAVAINPTPQAAS